VPRPRPRSPGETGRQRDACEAASRKKNLNGAWSALWCSAAIAEPPPCPFHTLARLSVKLSNSGTCQALARVHRLGQRRPVKVLRLASKGTLEEALLWGEARQGPAAPSQVRGAAPRGEARQEHGPGSHCLAAVLSSGSARERTAAIGELLRTAAGAELALGNWRLKNMHTT
jgi:hypothetical protein